MSVKAKAALAKRCLLSAAGTVCADSREYGQGELVDPATLRFQGVIQLMPASSKARRPRHATGAVDRRTFRSGESWRRSRARPAR
jgi:hypothetical protein